jgi:hypothetical protein
LVREPLITAPFGTRGAEDGRFVPATGSFVGAASAFFGCVLLIVWLQQRAAPRLLRLPPAPFFDRLVAWDRLSAMSVAQVVAAVTLLAAGAAILGRHRFALPLFILTGWGGAIFTVAAIWPGDGLRFKMRTAVNAAQKYGSAASQTTFWDLVPSSYVIGAALFAALWFGLLVAGTAHLVRWRFAYSR